MISTHNALVDQLLVPALFLFLLVAGLAGVALGAALILFRGRILRILGPMNRWVSGRKPLAALEAQYNIDSTVYKYRRLFSAVFILGAVFSLIVVFARLSFDSVVSMLGSTRFSAVIPWLVQGLAWMLLTGCLLAIGIGVILGFFPRALARIEAWTNRWYATRPLGSGADRMFFMVDDWVESSPRAAGWIIAIAALALAVSSAIVLLAREASR